MFPFCGKVIDMKYFWEQGHQVFGIDCAPEAIKDFYSEQGIEYETKALDDKSTCYSTKDGRMNLINTNFYTFDKYVCLSTIFCLDLLIQCYYALIQSNDEREGRVCLGSRSIRYNH